MVEKLAPESRSMANSLGTLGKAAWLAGDLSRAEDLQRRALAIEEARNPKSDWTSTHLINLAAVLVHRKELEAAEKLYLRALEIEERLSPESRGVAILLGNLGHVATERGNYEDARTFLLRSIAIKDKVAPDSVSLAVGLENLGRVAGRLGQIARAEELHHRAIDIIERKAPQSLRLADNYYELGNLAARRDAFEKARGFHRKALDIRSRFEPGSYKEAESRFALGEIALKTGDDLDAVGWFQGSIDAFEAQTTRLGGRQEVRAEFGATYLNYYQQLIRGLVELGRLEEAFNYVERSRSRTLLSMLAERELVLDSAIPADLKQERERIEAGYDRAQAELTKLDEADSSAEVERLRTQQRELHDSLERLKTRLRQLSPRLEALEYPEPFDLAGARKVLAPGTLLLSYVVTEQETLLFAVQPSTVPGDGLSVYRIEIGRESLAQRVSIFRSLIERSRNSTDVEQALREQGRHLFGLLLGSVREAIGAADRLLVSADGPLHMLPFSALVRDTGNPAAPRFEYLVEWKSLHRTMSATVYGELSEGRRNGRAGQPIQIAGFCRPGDSHGIRSRRWSAAGRRTARLTLRREGIRSRASAPKSRGSADHCRAMGRRGARLCWRPSHGRASRCHWQDRPDVSLCHPQPAGRGRSAQLLAGARDWRPADARGRERLAPSLGDFREAECRCRSSHSLRVPNGPRERDRW